jgi:transposase InsO family protein
MVHTIPVSRKSTASQLASIFLKEVVQLHRLPESIVSDHDPKFTSKWWREIHRLLGMKLLMSTSFHPQIDGATEHENHSIGQILSLMVCSEWQGYTPGFWSNVSFKYSFEMKSITLQQLFRAKKIMRASCCMKY